MSWHELLRTDRNIENAIHSPHHHLKVVKFLGYYGRASDVELVRYLVNNCVVLEKIIIDPRYQTDYFHTLMDTDEIYGEKDKAIYGSMLVAHDELEELDAVRTARNYAK
ncbi:hypothetical protein PHJA_001452200 [Phtheirospermum japonicum]|uniref:FBD domain-containing protein n=1 Tax=Phtheirospermum japonicum TaxID=374723 RepID=A0A830C235_9LAMI|nr:hypothetical protein PHJA_001452200 [Phtheirospermum japonicum]